MRTASMLVGAGLLALLAGLGSARAGGAQQVLVCYPGGGAVQPAQAKPAMRKMLGALESLGGWPAGTFEHSFTTKLDECRELLAEKKPAWVLLSLGLFLEQRQAEQLVPLVAPRMGEQSEEIYRALVRRGGPTDLAGLKGKSLGGSLLDERDFLARVVFEGQIDPQAYFRLLPAKRALSDLRKLAKGQLDAVLVNEQQYRALDSLPFAKDLQVAFTSRPLPLLGLAASAKRTTPAERDRMTAALAGLCDHPQGKEVCEMFGLKAFEKAAPRAFDRVIQLWDAK